MDRIHCQAPLPEDPTIPLLKRMLVPTPYHAPEKKAKKKGKEVRSGLRRKGTSDITSEDTEALSSHEGDEDEEEEEENNSPPPGGKEEKGRFRGPRGGGVQEGETLPFRRFGIGRRSRARVAPQAEALGRIVRIQR